MVGSAEGRGTRVDFMPDDTIFKDGIDYNFRAMVQRFREMAYLTKGLRFHIADERDGSEVNFYFEGGIRSYVRHLNKEKSVLHKLPFYCERDSNGVAVEVALQYTEAYDTDFDLCLRQQHQQHRWRRAPDRLPQCPDAGDQ